MNKSYNELLNSFASDKGTSPLGIEANSNGYGYLYDKFFEEYRGSAKHICEIGVENGRSIMASYLYFKNAYIHGLDIDDKSSHNSDRIFTYIVDQSSEESLYQFFNRMREQNISFDIIIDDGSHDVEHQQKTMGVLWDLLRSGGTYVMEDMGSSFFLPGNVLYGYTQTTQKHENNTHKFLTSRPLHSPWIAAGMLAKIDSEIEHIITFDKVNTRLPYFRNFSTDGNYGIRSITSLIKKK